MLVYRLAENHLAALSERPSFNRPDQIHLCFLDFDELAEQSSQLAISAQILGSVSMAVPLSLRATKVLTLLT